MKKIILFCLILTSVFLFGISTVSAAEKVITENTKSILVDANSNITLEDNTTFYFDNGVSITSNKSSDKNSISVNSIASPNGKWDLLGKSTFYNESRVFNSSGGDLRIDIVLEYVPPTLGTPYILQLREKDTLSSLVGQIEIKDHGTWTVDVRGLNDGDNKLSELFLRKLTYTGSLTGKRVYTTWYD